MNVSIDRGILVLLVLFTVQIVSGGGTFNPCSSGAPLTDSTGNELFCGRGSGRVDCPTGSSCLISPTDAFAVCCPDPDFNPCSNGYPLTDGSGTNLFCGRGPSRVDCPTGSSCLISPTDAFAVCCPDPDFNPCSVGAPLTDGSGNRLFCGRGSGRVDCPTGSSCLISPTDAFAVCCPDVGTNSSFLEDYRFNNASIISCYGPPHSKQTVIVVISSASLAVICMIVCCCTCKTRRDSNAHRRESERRKRLRNMHGCLMVAVIKDLIWTQEDIPVDFKGPPSYEESTKSPDEHATENGAPPPYDPDWSKFQATYTIA